MVNNWGSRPLLRLWACP